MPLSGSIFQSTMLGELAFKGFVGTNLITYVSAIASGSLLSLVGKPFTTTDTGSAAGAGAGSGIGLKVVKSLVSGSVFQESAAAFGSVGEKLKDLCDAIGAGLEAELAVATLLSQHTPVFAGSGVVDPGSIPVTGSEWGSNIMSAGVFGGEKWPDSAKAVGKGCASSLASATGQVVIVGSPTSPPPTPGASGKGTGVLS